MPDIESDHCPQEQRLRIAGQALADGEEEIADACDTLLLSLIDPVDLAPFAEFYSHKLYRDKERSTELCKRAARAAIAVLLADDGMRLPTDIGMAYKLPERV